MQTITIGIVLFRHERHEIERLLRSIDQALRWAPGLATSLAFKCNSQMAFDPCEVARTCCENLRSVSVYGGASNLGFGKAHNVLLAKTFAGDCDFYLCLNPDGVIHHEFLSKIVNLYNDQPNPALIEGRQFPREIAKPYDPLTGETPWCSGAALLISRRLYELVGEFDENIFMYCEDVDLSWRVRDAGLLTLFCADALFGHYVEEKKAAVINRIMIESARYLGHKWNARSFQREMEDRLLSEGYYPDRDHLPEFPNEIAFGSPDGKEFGQYLSFCTPRW